jgi:hypothetical protein
MVAGDTHKVRVLHVGIEGAVQHLSTQGTEGCVMMMSQMTTRVGLDPEWHQAWCTVPLTATLSQRKEVGGM